MQLSDRFRASPHECATSHETLRPSDFGDRLLRAISRWNFQISRSVDVRFIEKDGLLYDDFERLDVLVYRHLKAVLELVHLPDHLRIDTARDIDIDTDKYRYIPRDIDVDPET
jgi:hypothetical protein